MSETISFREYNYGRNTFSYSPLSPEQLDERHGLDGRYFTESPGLFPPRQPCVIDFLITSGEDSEITLLYDEAVLTDERGLSFTSLSREDFYTEWADKIAPSLRGRLNWLIDHNIHKKNIIVPPLSQRAGYFFFFINGDRWGEYLLTLPVIINKQRGTLSLPVTLDIDRPGPALEPAQTGPAFIPDEH